MRPTTEKKIGEITMSKLKKKAFAVILGCMLGIMGCLPVFAAEPGISPYVEATRCWNCNTGTIYTHRTETVIDEELVNGVVCEIVKVTVTSHCYDCGYSDSYTYEYDRPE